ncbi:type 1 glutamine amidotransferase [Pseudomonas saliphila]|uniref:type 1 glutamine amidotransferase n=1 Tax=Pseudomonas saliphila TaxID=2586906 RepID=UPI00123A4399|nr:type 1 glutamine amidotransferase [Pseudomonas saliphila]
MRAHYLQHADFEGPGSIETWLQRMGYGITSTHLYSRDLLPKLGELDLLIIMGGPMSVHDEAAYPWLITEKQFIRDAIAAGIPVLGVCLGAQLIADVMGARVFPGAEREIGWYPVQGLQHGKPECFQLPDELNVLHWHGETFDLPAGATRLASNAVFENQAFQLGDRVIGLQFHLEATAALVDAFVQADTATLEQGGTYVQTAADICAVTPEQLQATQSVMTCILDFLHRKEHDNDVS